jgi:hypothetical protein
VPLLPAVFLRLMHRHAEAEDTGAAVPEKALFTRLRRALATATTELIRCVSLLPPSFDQGTVKIVNPSGYCDGIGVDFSVAQSSDCSMPACIVVDASLKRSLTETAPAIDLFPRQRSTFARCQDH